MPFHRVQVSGDPPPAEGDVVAGLDAALAAISDDAVSVATIRRGSDGAVTYRIVELRGEPPTVRALHLELLDDRAPEDSLRFVPDASEAAAPALVIVGALMITQIRYLVWDDMVLVIPAFLTIVLMPFTYSITNGIGAGVISYVLLSAVTGRVRRIHPLMWVIAAMFVVYFALEPLQQLL